MAEAASLRATGASWESVARKLRRQPKVCQRWCEQYPVLWTQLLADAIRQTREKAANEAISTLRDMLRSENLTIRRDAAKALLAAEPELPPVSPKSDPETYLEELDDQEASQLSNAIAAIVPPIE